jgi:hypothetical protein
VGVRPLVVQKGLSCIKLSGLTINSFKLFSKSEGVMIILGHGHANLL